MAKINTSQKDYLCSFMETNYDFLYGKKSSANPLEKKEKWEWLKDALNDHGPPTKSVEKWEKVSIKVRLNFFICKSYFIHYLYN